MQLNTVVWELSIVDWLGFLNENYVKEEITKLILLLLGLL